MRAHPASNTKSGWRKLSHAIVAKSAKAQSKQFRVTHKVELPEGKAFFSRAEIVKLLGCHRTWLVQLIEKGIEENEIDGYDLRSPGSPRACLRLERESLIQFLASRKIIASGRKGITLTLMQPQPIIPDKPITEKPTSGPQQTYVTSPANQIGKSNPVEVNVHTAPPMRIERMDESTPNTLVSQTGRA